MTRQQALEQIADLIEVAKQSLQEANNIANEAGVAHSFESSSQDIYEEVTGSYVDWNASSC